MAKKRERLEIIYDILYAIKEKNGRLRQTNIMYKSNLSFANMQEYLLELINKKFIAEKVDKKNIKTYLITERGITFLLKYNEIKGFIDSFGT